MSSLSAVAGAVLSQRLQRQKREPTCFWWKRRKRQGATLFEPAMVLLPDVFSKGIGIEDSRELMAEDILKKNKQGATRI